MIFSRRDDYSCQISEPCFSSYYPTDTSIRILLKKVCMVEAYKSANYKSRVNSKGHISALNSDREKSHATCISAKLIYEKRYIVF